MSVLKAALGFVTTGYMNDAVIKPRATGKLARSYCDRVGKPLLLIRGERLVDVLVGDPVKAEAVQRRAYPLPYPDKAFGAVMVVNVLERLKRPDLAIREWRRVADKVFVVTPSWWAPHAWLDPGHRWVVHPDISRVMPLWTGHRSIYLLPVSDRGYGARPWSPSTPTSAPHPPNPSEPSDERSTPYPMSSDDGSHLFARNSESPFDPPPESTSGLWSDDGSESSPSSPFQPPSSSQSGDASSSPLLPPSSPSSDGPDPYDPQSPPVLPEMPDLDDLISSDLHQPHLGNPPSQSSSSPSHLTVVSTPGSVDF